MGKVRFFWVIAVGIVSLVLTSFFQDKHPIKYMQMATIKSSAADEPTTVEVFKDSISNETIFLRKSKDNIPIHYYKNVTGEVCFDEECRLLDIVVYWNVTGRYLGFELPKGEFLSKHDHDPFSESEYQRLHDLLADSSIPLDAVTFEKLVEPKSADGTVDAVSGATSKSVAEMVVKGAAYTTYRLWNEVNGPTMDIVSELTEKQITPELLVRILQSQDVTDQLWALKRIDSTVELIPILEKALLEFCASDDFYLAYTAINAITSVHLEDAELQEDLFLIYNNAIHSIQQELLEKLMEAPNLSEKVVSSSRDLLPQLNGQQLDDLLQLYTKHNVHDKDTYTAVAKILENENKFISKKAYDFLMGLHLNDVVITERLHVYKREKL